MIADADAYILAGGKSERMQTNKALLPWNGSTVIESLYSNLKLLFPNVYIVAKEITSYHNLGLETIKDLNDFYCPLVGIFTALKHTAKRKVFIKACDNPLFSKRLIYRLYEFTEDFDVVIPKTADGYHPLFGFYSKKTIPIVESMIKKEDFRIINLFGKVNTRFINDGDVAALDATSVSLKNLNTPYDYNEFKKQFGGKK